MSSPFPPSSYPEEGETGVYLEASKVGHVDVCREWTYSAADVPVYCGRDKGHDGMHRGERSEQEWYWWNPSITRHVPLGASKSNKPDYLRVDVVSGSVEPRTVEERLIGRRGQGSDLRTPPEAAPSSSPSERSGGDSVTPQNENLGGEQKLAVAGAGQLWMHRTPCPHGFTSMRHCTDCLAANLEDCTGRDEAGELEIRQNELYLAMGLVERMPASEAQTACISSMGERMRLLVGLRGKSEVGRSLTAATRGSASLPEPDPSVLEQRLGEAQEKEGRHV